MSAPVGVLRATRMDRRPFIRPSGVRRTVDRTFGSRKARFNGVASVAPRHSSKEIHVAKVWVAPAIFVAAFALGAVTYLNRGILGQTGVGGITRRQNATDTSEAASERCCGV